MNNNVIPFPKQPGRTTSDIPLPDSVGLICEGGTLVVYPGSHMVEQGPPLDTSPAGPPAIVAENGAVVLDLGDCTMERTLLSLDPESARAWARALVEMADTVEQQRGE